MKQDMFDKFFEKNPHIASHLGLHDPYDCMLPKGDTALILENHKILDEFVKQMKGTMDYDALSDANKIDWQVLEKALEMSKFEIYEQRKFELNPDAFDVIGLVFFEMITRDYALLEKRIDAIIARLEKLPMYLKEFQTRFEKSKPAKLRTELAIEAANSLPCRQKARFQTSFMESL